MEILIRNSDSQPIYEQIVRQVSGQILSGALPPGTALPSIRALARDLKISVITTKRAYDELEAAGYRVTVAGKGSFVAEGNRALQREARLREMEEHLTKAKMCIRDSSWKLHRGEKFHPVMMLYRLSKQMSQSTQRYINATLLYWRQKIRTAYER